MKRKTITEQPHQVSGQSAMTPKRRYFLPEAGVTVEATSPEEAAKKAKKLKKKEVGDGE